MPFAGWLEALADLVFPPRCVYCRRLGSDFCSACAAAVTPLSDAICVRCGQPTATRSICADCRGTLADPLQGMRGVVFFGGAIAFAIHGFKYRGMRRLAQPLALYLAAYLQAHPLEFACLAPVPLHPERLAFRGYNQSELLARELGVLRRLPVRSDLIERTRPTLPQVHLNRAQRLENVHEAFAPLQAGALQGERVLLIDDVCTTGATLRASAQALRAAGAGEVWALVVARAFPGSQRSELGGRRLATHDPN